jgi:hypothetical protein
LKPNGVCSARTPQALQATKFFCVKFCTIASFLFFWKNGIFCRKKILDLEGKNHPKNEQFWSSLSHFYSLVKVGTKIIEGIFYLKINYVIQVAC